MKKNKKRKTKVNNTRVLREIMTLKISKNFNLKQNGGKIFAFRSRYSRSVISSSLKKDGNCTTENIIGIDTIRVSIKGINIINR